MFIVVNFLDALALPKVSNTIIKHVPGNSKKNVSKIEAESYSEILICRECLAS